jgi:hypothetical protein
MSLATKNLAVSLDELVKSFSAPGQEHLVSLVETFAASINNPEFTGDRKKVLKATKAQILPDPEKIQAAKLKGIALSTLRAKAAKEAEKPGGSYVAPTQAQVAARVDEQMATWRANNPK